MNNEDCYNVVCSDDGKKMFIVCDGRAVMPVVKLPVKRFVIVFLSTGKKTCMNLIPLKRHIRLQREPSQQLTRYLVITRWGQQW